MHGSNYDTVDIVPNERDQHREMSGLAGRAGGMTCRLTMDLKNVLEFLAHIRHVVEFYLEFYSHVYFGLEDGVNTMTNDLDF